MWVAHFFLLIPDYLGARSNNFQNFRFIEIRTKRYDTKKIN